MAAGLVVAAVLGALRCGARAAGTVVATEAALTVVAAVVTALETTIVTTETATIITTVITTLETTIVTTETATIITTVITTLETTIITTETATIITTVITTLETTIITTETATVVTALGAPVVAPGAACAVAAGVATVGPGAALALRGAVLLATVGRLLLATLRSGGGGTELQRAALLAVHGCVVGTAAPALGGLTRALALLGGPTILTAGCIHACNKSSVGVSPLSAGRCPLEVSRGRMVAPAGPDKSTRSAPISRTGH
ncbi:hypothetical protein [Tessaracoccus defluvii]|uniref:hypothetical protein n=1 Tax=Tessaracoccus defluvii TaxID=1285901 RepID=UPI0031D238CE